MRWMDPSTVCRNPTADEGPESPHGIRLVKAYICMDASRAGVMHTGRKKFVLVQTGAPNRSRRGSGGERARHHHGRARARVTARQERVDGVAAGGARKVVGQVLGGGVPAAGGVVGGVPHDGAPLGSRGVVVAITSGPWRS